MMINFLALSRRKRGEEGEREGKGEKVFRSRDYGEQAGNMK